MNGVIEALLIYDEHNSLVLSHTYTSRPLSPTYLLPLYLQHPTPRPNLIYLSHTNPPTLVFSLRHANLLLLLTTSSEIEPLLVLEFLHRVVDTLEEFLGAPLLAHKIESNYDVVAQLLTEMCDGGTVATTEPNALRDLVEVEGFMGKLLGNLSLPAKTTGVFGGSSPTPSLLPNPSSQAHGAPALPWRRANVRHTSNELYADVIETLTVTLAPSGRPLAAFASGTIAFTSKVSGVPDICVTLTGPSSGRHGLAGLVDLPVFHPCVRLARWREQPGVLSFVPPDGRFTLAGYEVDLLPVGLASNSNALKLPVTLDVKTGLGPAGADFEVRLQVHKIFGNASRGSQATRSGAGSRGLVGGPQPGTPASPLLQDVRVAVPLPFGVRNVPEIRPSRGDASYNPVDRVVEWTLPAKDLTSTTSFSLRCIVVGQPDATSRDDDDDDDPTGFGFGAGKSYAYDEEQPYQQDSSTTGKGQADIKDERRVAQNRMLMPSSASVSFAVKGWLASGVKVESIVLDPRKSRGLGESVKPYKGVKYLTVSKGGVEIRC